jgi:cystathionine beta-lyase/cystathionine gamma-synthase
LFVKTSKAYHEFPVGSRKINLREQLMNQRQPLHYDSLVLHGAAAYDEATGALSIPIYPASTYRQKDVSKRQEFDYGRSGNPTRKALEATLAMLEGGNAGFAFASGMASVHAAITALVKTGDHIVATRDCYGGTYRFLTDFLPRFGVACTFADTTNPADTRAALRPETRVLFLESPSNPMLKITDLSAHAQIAHEHGIVTMIDNTFLSPYYLRPISHGIDISIHSATKFLGGHSDLIAGAVITRTEEHANAVRFVQNTCGGVLSPENSWLLLRGIKTLGARMRCQQETAVKVAEWLARQAWVTNTYYPGLTNHPGRDVLLRQATGTGCVVSFTVDTPQRLGRLLSSVRLLSVAVSLGGVESILSYPARMSHAAMPAAVRAELGITDTLLRLSVGLEAVEDIVDDLAQGAAQ